MIAWTGAMRLSRGLTDDLAAPVRARWPLDPDAPPAIGAGVRLEPHRFRPSRKTGIGRRRGLSVMALQSVGIVGAGAWGTALAVTAKRAGRDVADLGL